METKHTREYARKLANEYVDGDHYDKFGHSGSFLEGYMRAVKETNAKELLEALIMVKEWAEEYGMAEKYYNQVVNAINKVK